MAKRSVNFSLVNAYAAGIDVGSKSHFASIGTTQECIREFSVFTESLHEMARWFKTNKIKTIAMESTGFHWKSLFLLLQDYGFEVILVNAAHIKNASRIHLHIGYLRGPMQALTIKAASERYLEKR